MNDIKSNEISNEISFFQNKQYILEIFRQKYLRDYEKNDYFKTEIISNFMKNDNYIEKFFIANEYNFNKSYNMLEKMLQWRFENDVDNYENWNISNYKNVDKLYPKYYHYYTKDKYPIYIEKPGAIIINDLLKITTMDEMIKMYIYNMEYMRNILFTNISKKENKIINKSFSIIDINNMSYKSVNSDFFHYIKTIIEIGQNNYPETVYKVYIINVPVMFHSAWKIVSKWLCQNTRDKIKVLKKKNLKELLEYIDINKLSIEYGGKCKCDICNKV